MTWGKPVSEDLRWMIVWMSRLVWPDIISTYTDVSLRQIMWILALHRATGKVSINRDRWRIGRRRHLTMEDVNVGQDSFAMLITLLICVDSSCMGLWTGIVIATLTSWRRGWRTFVVCQLVCLLYGGPYIERATAWRRCIDITIPFLVQLIDKNEYSWCDRLSNAVL